MRFTRIVIFPCLCTDIIRSSGALYDTMAPLKYLLVTFSLLLLNVRTALSIAHIHRRGSTVLFEVINTL